MLDTPQILQTAAQTAAVIHLIVPRSDMMKVFGPAAGELMAALAAQGIKPEGAIFAHHLKMSVDNFDFELGVRVSTPVKAIGRMTPGELPAAKVAPLSTVAVTRACLPRGASSPIGSRPMDTNKPMTCGSYILSGHNRRPIQRDGARN